MRLSVKKAANVHTDLAAACGWSVWNELFSCADEQTVHKWNLGGEPEGKVRAGGRVAAGFGLSAARHADWCPLDATWGLLLACRCASWMPTSQTCTGTP